MRRYITSCTIFYSWFKASYIFSFVECNVFVCVIGYQNVNRCFSFDVMDAIGDVDIRVSSCCRVLISNEVSLMFLNCLTCDFDWYDTIVSRSILRDDLTIPMVGFCSQFLVDVRNFPSVCM